MTNSLNTRELVLDMLLEITKDGTPSHIAMRNTLSKYQYLDKPSRAFITKVAQGTIENQILLDYIINQFSNTKTSKMKPLIRELIRMSTYQIIYMDKTPDSAICNEAVGLAKKRGFKTLTGFVNGVLRNISRNKANIVYPKKEDGLDNYLSIMYSTPLWIVEMLHTQYGEEIYNIIEGMNSQTEGITLRIDPRIKDIDGLVCDLQKDGINVSISDIYPLAITIKDFDYLLEIDKFNDGSLYPQDISSMLVSHIANPPQSANCIDLCSAPGGKAIHLSQILNGTGHVSAFDISDMKVSYIRENISRCNVDNISANIQDATEFSTNLFETGDVVLADVPCSGLGVTRKKSDIKYNLSKDNIPNLIDLQRQILVNAVKYLKVGGTLIFSTCTINKQENIENLRWLLENFPLKTEDISSFLPGDYHNDEAKKGYIQLLPGIDPTDGFFLAKLIKQEHYE